MKAGPELDALVAEKVMESITGPVVEIVGGKAVNAEGHSVLLPCYSADIAAAWEVVERMDDDGYRMKLEVNPAIRGHCEVSFQEAWPHPLNEWSREWSEERDAIPVLICLAALKASGIKMLDNS